MTPGDIAVIVIAAVVIISAVIWAITDRKKRGSGCCGNCSSCGKCKK